MIDILLKIEGTERIHEIEKIIMHEHPDAAAGYDIALLKLDRALRYSSAVRPICVDDNPVPDWTNCVAIGWGDTQGRLCWKAAVLIKYNRFFPKHNI